MKTIFETKDGSQFSNEIDAKSHEAALFQRWLGGSNLDYKELSDQPCDWDGCSKSERDVFLDLLKQIWSKNV